MSQAAAGSEQAQSSWRLAPSGIIAGIRTVLPAGRGVPDEVWQRRHLGIVVLLWLHAVGLTIFGLLMGRGVLHSAAESSLVALAALVAGSGLGSRKLRAAIASMGLVTASAVLVHFSGGFVEMHFHFFVVVVIISLYQDWLPFLVAIGYVALHHGVVGVLDPAAVYNHPAAQANPWLWAGIHAAFVLAASGAALLAWRLNEHQALHDPLTRLANRTLLMDRIGHALAHSQRYAEQLAVLFVDLDNFKNVNDSLGHAAGDRLLVEAARRLETCIRGSDTIARLGGDEFAILIEGTKDQRDILRVAERIVESMGAPFTIRGTQVTVSASIGIALGSHHRQRADEMVRNADVAMYVAKSLGKSRFEVFEAGMHAAILRRLELESDLQRAVERQEFVVYYQPIVALDSEQIVGVEALVRWEHPTRGLVSPADFIPVAEETGMIVAIGNQVLRQACEQALTWHTPPGSSPITLSVNLSARQLQQPNIVEDVATIVRDAGLDPARLTLEITESAMMRDTEATIGKLKALKAIGLRLAIDDFGTGYSSLSYLHRFPVDILKIDKSFVDGVGSGAAESPLVRAIITLGRTLQLRTVAEGVELVEQGEHLRVLGCELAQGFYFAKPLPGAEVRALFAGGSLVERH